MSKQSKLRYLKYLVYLIPIALIFGAYFAVGAYTQESNPFTVVTGTSMEPTIPAGTVAVISKVPFNQLQIGDVIVFEPIASLDGGGCQSSPGGSLTQETSSPCFVIHRIYKMNNSTGQEILTTKGDNNQGPIAGYDTDINSSMYVGKVVFALPYVGYLTVTPYNEYAVLILIVAFILPALWDSRKKSDTLPPETQ